jgi:serine-type D-Ala-D-Ala carboxypeptidase (penicillin-binding protein 5/6)
MERKMELRTKILIGIFALTSIVFLIGGENSFANNLNDVVYWSKMNKDPDVIAREKNLNTKLENLLEAIPSRDEKIEQIELKATSAISLLLNNQSKERVLFEKDIDKKVPIASLTKLMTVWVVSQYYDLSDEITVSAAAANQKGDPRPLKEGDTFSVNYLLYPLLVESSNSAAFALSEKRNDFIELMNYEAKKMGLENTFFANPTGLDPEWPKKEVNHSTAKDLSLLTKKLLEEKLIWEILSLPAYSLYGPELINTNHLLSEKEGIIGGKTGYTDLAGGCLVLVSEAPRNKGKIINIVLGTNGREDRFEEMKKLINWLETAYRW